MLSLKLQQLMYSHGIWRQVPIVISISDWVEIWEWIKVSNFKLCILLNASGIKPNGIFTYNVASFTSSPNLNSTF